MKILRRLGAYIYVPLLFIIIGYGCIWMAGKPVIDFATSISHILFMNDAPKNSGNVYQEGKLSKNVVFVSSIKFPTKGNQFGEVSIDSLKVSLPLYYGDDVLTLDKGAGMYTNSSFPGFKGATVIGGHNRPIFGNVYYLKVGNTFEIKTSYGNFTYEVESNQILKYDDNAFFDTYLSQREQSYAILYTCYPLDAIGWANDRSVAVGKLIDGPIIDDSK
ncbi:MAG: class D sortase [Streptococcaceae bacterium]|jgi:sortase A|nr:class D sortase [Streptococcaceae bacterium]